MNPIEQFKAEVADNIRRQGADKDVQALSRIWAREIGRYKYTYNFAWMGRPIIQLPQDMVAMQELIWQVRPDVIVETGVAHGGSLIFSASMLALLDMTDAIASGELFDPRVARRKVIGIDIDIRAHNRAEIEAHPMASRIELVQGSSIDPAIVEQVCRGVSEYKTVMVCLDSNHTHEHVLEELKSYAPLVSVGSYCVVFDTLLEDMPAEMFTDRPWGPGNSPKTAVWKYLESQNGFQIDESIPHKLLLTVAPDGFLRRVS